jgi:hypothetical protein
MARRHRERARFTKWCWSWLKANLKGISIVLVACCTALTARHDSPRSPEYPDPDPGPIALDCSRLRWQLAAEATLQCLPLFLGSSPQTPDIAGCVSAITRLVPRECNDPG